MIGHPNVATQQAYGLTYNKEVKKHVANLKKDKILACRLIQHGKSLMAYLRSSLKSIKEFFPECINPRLVFVKGKRYLITI